MHIISSKFIDISLVSPCDYIHIYYLHPDMQKLIINEFEKHDIPKNNRGYLHFHSELLIILNCVT